MKRITLKAVNAAIAKEFPNVQLFKGEGCFYIFSEHPETALKIAGLYQCGIYVYRLGDFPLERWVQEVKQLLKDEPYFATNEN